MGHRENGSGQLGTPRAEEPLEHARVTPEWEADTDVMPPEYCKQLLAISRRLQRTR